jgi:alpha-beta hydrolase superfamily lysophospholipase
VSSTREIHTPDGRRLHQQIWPVAGPARGLVYLVHGLGEHIGRYAWLAKQLNGLGWQVQGHDHVGHGRSSGARGRLPAEHTLLQDLGLLLGHARQQAAAASGPLLLLGHSLGGAVAARYAVEGLAAAPAAWYQPVQGLVLSSPGLDIGLNAAQRALLAVLPGLLPNLGLGNGLKPEWISRDAEVVRQYMSDPLVHAQASPRLVKFLVDAGAVVLARAPRWQTPTLLLWGGADRCVRPRDLQRAGARGGFRARGAVAS